MYAAYHFLCWIYIFQELVFYVDGLVLVAFTMFRILDFPNEVVLLIYQRLGDLDDVLHLGRTCRQLYNLLEHGKNRLQIFRSVIV